MSTKVRDANDKNRQQDAEVKMKSKNEPSGRDYLTYKEGLITRERADTRQQVVPLAGTCLHHLVCTCCQALSTRGCASACRLENDDKEHRP